MWYMWEGIYFKNKSKSNKSDIPLTKSSFVDCDEFIIKEEDIKEEIKEEVKSVDDSFTINKSGDWK